MKIQSLSIFILIISFSTYQTAWAQCLIKDKSAPALSDYIKDNRTVIKNITNEIVKEKNKKDIENIKKNKTSSWFEKFKSKASEDFNNSSWETSSIFNEIFNFTWYYSYFKYYVTYPISNEIPAEVKRDYALINNENKWLLSYIKKIDKEGNAKVVILEPCKSVIKWVEKCKELFNWKESKYIIWKLIKNNYLILDLYRNSVMWEDVEYDEEKFVLIDENFLNDISSIYYSKESVNKCNKDKWWFFKQITTAIDNIKLINKQWEDWIKKWQEAYNLLIWKEATWEEDKIAARKLKEYLSESWYPTDKQEIIMQNLANSKSDTFSLNNNFLENTFSSTLKKLKKDLVLWKKQNIWDSIPKDSKTISTQQIKKSTTNAEVSQDLQKTIRELYESEVPFIWVWNITTESLRSKIINSHISLQNWIKTLDHTIKISQKVCKSQWWWWICD